MNLLQIPGGVVDLWDARRASHRSVEVHGYEIAEIPVTIADYERHRSRPSSPTEPGLPAIAVAWLEAATWCNMASAAAGLDTVYSHDGEGLVWDFSAGGYRLPTEAEWVHASRAGTSGPRYGQLTDIAWSADDDVTGPQPVAQKAPNDFGLYDTIGNTWEWCWDRLDPARYGDYRVFKGGAWADPAWSCRVGVRRGNAIDAIVEDVGFRIARGAVTPLKGADGVQGWSENRDRERASIAPPLPVGWTPLKPR